MKLQRFFIVYYNKCIQLQSTFSRSQKRQQPPSITEKKKKKGYRRSTSNTTIMYQQNVNANAALLPTLRILYNMFVAHSQPPPVANSMTTASATGRHALPDLSTILGFDTEDRPHAAFLERNIARLPWQEENDQRHPLLTNSADSGDGGIGLSSPLVGGPWDDVPIRGMPRRLIDALCTFRVGDATEQSQEETLRAGGGDMQHTVAGATVGEATDAASSPSLAPHALRSAGDEGGAAGGSGGAAAGGTALRDDCPICLEAMAHGSLVRRLPCHHTYHAACIDRWLEKHLNCPCCRQRAFSPEALISQGMAEGDPDVAGFLEYIMEQDELQAYIAQLSGDAARRQPPGATGNSDSAAEGGGHIMFYLRRGEGSGRRESGGGGGWNEEGHKEGEGHEKEEEHAEKEEDKSKDEEEKEENEEEEYEAERQKKEEKNEERGEVDTDRSREGGGGSRLGSATAGRLLASATAGGSDRAEGQRRLPLHASAGPQRANLNPGPGPRPIAAGGDAGPRGRGDDEQRSVGEGESRVPSALQRGDRPGSAPCSISAPLSPSAAVPQPSQPAMFASAANETRREAAPMQRDDSGEGHALLSEPVPCMPLSLKHILDRCPLLTQDGHEDTGTGTDRPLLARLLD
jgi:hypothetical protein